MVSHMYNRNEVQKVLTHITDKPNVCPACTLDDVDRFHLVMLVKDRYQGKSTKSSMSGRHHGRPTPLGRVRVIIRFTCECDMSWNRS